MEMENCKPEEANTKFYCSFVFLHNNCIPLLLVVATVAFEGQLVAVFYYPPQLYYFLPFPHNTAQVGSFKE